MDPATDVCQTEQPQISYSVDFTAEQSSAMGSPDLLGREGSVLSHVTNDQSINPAKSAHVMILNCLCLNRLMPRPYYG